MSKSPVLFSSDDEDEGPCQEAEMLKKFQLMLQGVPPPCSVTMSKLSVTDILQKYNENETLYGIRSQDLNTTHKFSQKNNVTPLVYYSNSSQISEEIANLSQKVQFRYIYSETMSSCNIWFDSVIKTSSAKKCSGRRNGFGLSPGSRLSHLARRRKIFSCENLQQLANSDKQRHIEIKKQSALKSRISERNKPIESEKVNSFKRALFLSPDEEDSNKGNVSSSSIKRNLFSNFDKTSQSSSRNIGISKQLFSQCHIEGSSKKRRRTDSREPNATWPRRALTFMEEDSDKNQETNLRNAKVISEVQLSLHHKSKLLWAVSVTLKEKNISSKDPEFKTCASALFMLCRKNLGKILNSKKDVRTSEKMLHFAREQIGGVFKRLGIFRDDSSKQVASEGSHVENNISSESCSEHNKDNVDNCRETFTFKENTNSSINGESPLRVRINEVQTNINEKENIDVSTNSDSYP